MKKMIAIVIVVVLVLAFVLLKKDHSGEVSAIEKDRFSVILDPATKRDLKNELLLSGSVKALEEATLFPRVEGKLLRNVLKEGSVVQKGQTVSLIERDEVGAVYEPVVVPSTISGVVGRVYLDSGANVTRNTQIAFVVNQTKVRIILDIPERYVGKIYKGQSASFMVESLDAQKFDAVVNIISPVIDTNNRSVMVELLADNSKGLLKSGMFAKADIVLDEKKNALSIQSSSIYKDDKNNAYVYVPNGDTAVRRDIKIGFINGDYTEVASGLKEGEGVISFVFGIKDGSKILIKG